MATIKDLWVVSQNGLCLYRYATPASEYSEIDRSMFSGLIVAMSQFAEALSGKSIEFVKLSADELYLFIHPHLTVAAIFGAVGGEQHIVNQILEFIADKFLVNYGKHLDQSLYDWDLIADDFTSEIEFIMSDDIYEEFKREMVNELLMSVVQKQATLEEFRVKLAQLFVTSSIAEVSQAMETVKSLLTLVPSLADDVLLETKVTDILQNTLNDLEKRDRGEEQMYILHDDSELYQALFYRLLASKTVAVPVKTPHALQEAVNTHDSELPYNVVIIMDEPELDFVYEIVDIKLDVHARIIWWVKDIDPYIEETICARKNCAVIKRECHACLEKNVPIVLSVILETQWSNGHKNEYH